MSCSDLIDTLLTVFYPRLMSCLAVNLGSLPHSRRVITARGFSPTSTYGIKRAAFEFTKANKHVRYKQVAGCWETSWTI